MGYNYADENINNSEMKYEIEEGKRQWDSALEGDAQNTTIYELLLDLCRDPFVVGYHVP